jgi:hypothetical protein
VIEKQLVAKGWTVNIPISAQRMKETNDFEVSHFKGVFSYEQKGKFIHENFKKISQGDAILVINNEKNGIQGYIGTNVLMEIALAFFCKEKIFLWNPIPKDASYTEELLSFSVEVVNQNVNKISLKP